MLLSAFVSTKHCAGLYRPYDTVVRSEEFLDFDTSVIDRKMFAETPPFKPSISDWNYSQHFPSASVSNMWPSYHLINTSEQLFGYSVSSAMQDPFSIIDKTICTNDSNSLDSWLPENCLKQSPGDTYITHQNAAASSDLFNSYSKTTQQEMPKVPLNQYPFDIKPSVENDVNTNCSVDCEPSQIHQCVQCSRQCASIGGLKRHLKVCKVLPSNSQPIFNSLNQLNNSQLVSVKRPSPVSNSLPVDLSSVGKNLAFIISAL